jgi:hypothetical protein
MSQAAESDGYRSAVRRLKIHLTDLADLCEERLGLQRVASDNPYMLSSLLNAISEVLQEVCASTADEALRIAARYRELSFDQVTDPMLQHMTYQYSEATQAFEAWSKYRRQLREELDVLGTWASELLIATYVIMTGITLARFGVDKRVV